MVSFVVLAIGVGAVASGVGVFFIVVAGIHKEPSEMDPRGPGAIASVARSLLGVSVIRPSRRRSARTRRR